MVITKSSFAQYSQDAIRYSTFQTGSTSRIKAIGNAGTAVGGDLSSISGNPAGLGFFTKNELSITPEFDGSKVSASYLGQSNSASANSLNLSNAAVVFYSRLNTLRGQDKTAGWLSLNFGMGYSHTNNYGENIYAAGKNNSSSITDYYANLANSQGISDGTLQNWAYSHNLIDQYGTDANPNYRSNTFTGTSQLNSITRTGGESEFDFSLGANYSNKLYLGVGLGLTDLRYNSINSFTETGVASVLENGAAVNRNYNSTYSQIQNTKGSGFNARFGAIYKPIEVVRLGLTVTTPTWYSIDDSYNEALVTSLSNNKNYQNAGSYPLSYNMRTPMKVAGGLAVFIQQFGFITGDVEYLDYSTTHISSNDDYDNSFDNSNIKSLYHATFNSHVGAEARLTGALMLRGGYGVQGSPLKQGGKSTNTVSGGLGYRFGSYYVDVTYAYVTGSQLLIPYDAGIATPTASLSKTYNNAFLTLGYRY